jgi:hypothetical protein
MKQKPRARPLLLSLLAVLAATGGSPAQILAFPGAEGFGRLASGGRGGDVYIVTNLNDAGAGSLREGIANRTAGVPRTIVFAISGTIYLNSTLRINDGDLTIAGQSAPGDGICLAHYPIDPSGSSNVIIRFLRSRLGDTSGKENDAFSCRSANTVIVDHCSFSWSVDETATSYDNTNFTMQWCVISESLRDSLHSKGPHGYGAIWGGLGATYHHNLIAHHDSRNPRFNGARTHGTAGELVDMRNNVIYNWCGNSTYGGEPTDAGLPARHNMINNYYKDGPATPSGARRYRILDPTPNPASTGAEYSLFHIAGNHTTASATVSADNWDGGVQVIDPALLPGIRENNPFAMPAPVTQPAVDAYPVVISHAGCTRPARDTHDTRIVAEVTNGSFTYRGSKGDLPGIIDSQADVGGWPVLNSTAPPADGDADGMPDAWETARDLNPADPADRNATNPAGYTNLELYLNELAAPAFPFPAIGAQPEPVTIPTGQPFSLSVAASGIGTLTYQWLLDGNPIAGANTATYQVAAATLADTGSYSVIVTNEYGSSTSETAVVVLAEQPPTITTDPSSSSLDSGQSHSLMVSATGTTPLSYQWFRGERAIDGATAASLDLGSVTLETAGPYHVVVANSYGSEVSATAMLTVTQTDETTVFSTTFGSDTIHSASPAITPTATNWHVMSSKNATGSSVGGASGLDLTMTTTSSGVIDSPALFSGTPVAIPNLGERLRLRMTLQTTNVRALGIGLFHSAASSPYSTLDNGQLSGASSTEATGGTQVWNGYRCHLDQALGAGPTLAIEGRPTQPGTTNASQSVIAPGTSSSAPTIVPLAKTIASGFSWNDGSTYTLTFSVVRGEADALDLHATVHSGADTTASPLAETHAVTTETALAYSFDALAVGFRNRDSGSVPHVHVSAVAVDHVAITATAAHPYEAFLAGHGLDPLTDGLFDTDDERDGVANAFEFIHGGNPHLSDPAVLPRLLPDGPAWTLRFLEHIHTSSSFETFVESSGELETWTRLIDGSDGVSITRGPFDPSFDQVEVHLQTAAPIFLRLAATPR